MTPTSRILPATRADLLARGWDGVDVLLVTGDAFVDHPSFGVAVIARVLEADGWRVGVVAAPDWKDPAALRTLGRPRLFVGVTAGNLDSMLVRYTAGRRLRDTDEYAEGGVAGGRPSHASVVYAQLARAAFPGVTVVLGGIEASLRRHVHYDYWEDRVRPSVVADAKADLLVYGMGESAVREAARRLDAGRGLDGIPGTARLLGAREAAALDRGGCVELPALSAIKADPALLLPATRAVEAEQNPWGGHPLLQPHGDRLLRVEPPAPPLDPAELDRVHGLPFTRKPHPSHRGEVPAWVMVRDSIIAVRGCAGGCAFCGLGLHQGRFLASRSPGSLADEARRIAADPTFRGTITDVGGPTANLYGCRNGVDEACRKCRRTSCLHPAICRHLRVEARPGVEALRAVRAVPGVRHAFIQSGVRMDVALRQPPWLSEVARHHVSGQLKVAPEHLDDGVLRRMRKPPAAVFHAFRQAFEAASRSAGKRQALVPYFISSFPGCTDREMRVIEDFLRAEGWRPQQVQDFLPLPGTIGAAMYVAGRDEQGNPIPVVRGLAERRRQIQALKGR